MPTIIYRHATIEDSRAAFEVYQAALVDLGQRRGFTAITGGDDPSVMSGLWQRRRPLFEHLAQTADQFWVAEYSDGSDAKVIGYARSILRERVRELTELFVHPDCQSAGVGRELLQRAFPADNTRHRVIIATPDTPALARYLKCGVAPYFPTATFSRAPRRLDLAPGLEVTRMPGGLPTGPLQNRSRLRGTGPLRPPNNAVLPPTLATPTQSILSTIDQQVLGHTRPVDHTWLMGQMDGYIYRWHSQVIGYGYVGADGGPFALMYPANYPAVLAHAEREAALRNFPQFYLEVPLINRSAVDWLLSNGYTMSNFLALFMSETHWGCFENYIFPSPPFFL